MPLPRKSAPEMILLRHGETQWNRARRYQGQQDSPLTLTGIGQVRAIAETLRDHINEGTGFDIWSSPLPRARQSISIFCDQLDLDYGSVRFDDRLMERSYGRWEGLARDDISCRYPEDLAREDEDRWHFNIPHGESFKQVGDRLGDWLHELNANQPVLVMAHGGSGRVLRGIVVGQSPEHIFANDPPQSTAFSIADGQARSIAAEQDHLRSFGCADQGLGVRI
ncbi:Fructose-2,6-bisphosphatase [Magnetospira sp. QH-2]|nr:Fructose-2,6-bisphosphatase [Magnetospira sp. QH-2]